MCAELLSEAGVGAGHVHSQAVLHPLQEGHPALTLLLKALPPQSFRLKLTAHRKQYTVGKNYISFIYNMNLEFNGVKICPELFLFCTSFTLTF